MAKPTSSPAILAPNEAPSDGTWEERRQRQLNNDPEQRPDEEDAARREGVVCDPDHADSK